MCEQTAVRKKKLHFQSLNLLAKENNSLVNVKPWAVPCHKSLKGHSTWIEKKDQCWRPPVSSPFKYSGWHLKAYKTLISVHEIFPFLCLQRWFLLACFLLAIWGPDPAKTYSCPLLQRVSHPNPSQQERWAHIYVFVGAAPNWKGNGNCTEFCLWHKINNGEYGVKYISLILQL